jgi:hypothetical protein
MEPLSPKHHRQLINAIASKEGNARYIASKYGYTVPWLRNFVEENKEELEQARQAMSIMDEPTPTELGDLWISSKSERLRRYQAVADKLYLHLTEEDSTDSTVLREFRSYLAAVANELGQLLHRGSGEINPDDTLSVEFVGVDLDKLREGNG